MGCNLCPDEKEIFDFLLGKLSENKIDDIGDHIQSCDHCSEITQRLENENDLLLIALKSSDLASYLEHELEFQQLFETALNRSQTDAESKWSVNEPPEEFGRYQIHKSLGFGSMGVVYLAKDNHLDRHVAIKILHFFKKQGERQLERFLQESRIVSHIDHPNICKVYDAGHVDPFYYITMQHVQGETLNEYIRSSVLSLEEKVQLVIQIAKGMHYAHEQGVIHRDLKPENIIVKENGEPVVTDFGLACNYLDNNSNPRLTFDGMLLGSPAYMSPEQASGKTDVTSPQSDIYSLAVILFEIVTDKLPFEGNVTEILAKTLKEQPPLASESSENEIKNSKYLDQILTMALSKQQANRPATMDEFAQHLEVFRDSLLENTQLDFTDLKSGLKTSGKKGKSFLSKKIAIFIMFGVLSVILFFSVKVFLNQPSTQPGGAIKINMDDETVKVVIDGLPIDKESLTNELYLTAGSHNVRLIRNRVVFYNEDFIVNEGRNPPLNLKTRW